MCDLACFTILIIWKSRCAKIFKNRSLNLVEISSNVLMQLGDWNKLTDNHPTQSQSNRQNVHEWLPPSNNIIEINFDASHIDKNSLSG